MESQLSYGFQCKSSEYTFDNGQKEGYLITVAGKEVTDITMTGKSFENTSDDVVLTGKTAWEYDLKEMVGACKMYPCVEKTVSGYPAITFSIFTTDEKMGALNAEMTSIFIDNNAYVLSARAKTQIESKKILSKMEERFSLTQDTNSTTYKNQEAGIYTISDLNTEQGVFDAITKGTPLEGHTLVKEDQYTFTDGKSGDDTVGYKRNRADYTVYNGNNVSEKGFFNTIIVVGKAEHFIEVDVNSEFIQFADQIVSIPDFNVVPNAKRY